MLRTQTQALSDNLKIPMENLRWFAAFHNEGHHPHVHLIAYSIVENEGYLTKQGVNNLRSSFAKDIFAQDLLCVYEKQTEHRNELKQQGRETLAEIVAQINLGGYDNPKTEALLMELACRLSKTNGKKVYGYLKSDVKDLVDAIVIELSKDERISALYDLWYEQREEVLKTYTQEMPERVPLVQNKEFKSIKNAVIRAAMRLPVLSKKEDDLEEDGTEKAVPVQTEPDTTSEKHVQLSSAYPMPSTALALFRLLQNLARLIQSQTDDKRKGPSELVERKLKRRINEKKQLQRQRRRQFARIQFSLDREKRQAVFV